MKLLYLFFLFNTLLLFGEDNSEEALDIFKTAQNNLKQMDYRSVIEKGKDKKDVFYHRADFNGSEATRREIFSAPPVPSNPLNPYVEITNHKGRFRILPDRVLKLNFQMGAGEINEGKLSIGYDLSVGKYNNEDSYIVTRKIKPDKFAYQEYVKTLPPQCPASQYEEKFKSFFGAVEKFYISKSDLFIRKVDRYGINGNFIGSREYGNVFLNEKLPDELFEIPVHKSIVPVYSNEEYFTSTSSDLQKAAAKHIKPVRKKASAWERFAGFTEQNVNLIFEWGGRFALFLSIVCIVVVAVMKFKKMKS